MKMTQDTVKQMEAQSKREVKRGDV